MKKLSNVNSDFEYELLDESQKDIDLREKLANLYATPYADILWEELRDLSLINHGYYKLYFYEQSVLKHIILFKYSVEAPGKIFIINKSFTIYLSDIDHIARILFNEFDKLQQIIFTRLFVSNPEQLPKMLFEESENDVIISFPESMDAYLKSLGTSTRKKIKLMTNRIARDFPDFKVHYFEKSDILFEYIQEIASLNRDRMKTKGINSFNNEKECKLLYQYATTSGFGLLCVCTINDRIVGGTINFIIREHAYMQVIAHDNAFNNYSVGQIALINATKFLIEEKKIKHYHLLNGNLQYKYLHGGIRHDRYNFRIFRNNDLYYWSEKIKLSIKNIFKKYKQKFQTHGFYTKFKNNKSIYGFYIMLKRIKLR